MITNFSKTIYMARDIHSMEMATFLTTIAMAYLLGASRPAADGARILAIAPIAAKSHWNFMRGILRALTADGHRVTAFTPFPDGDRVNYTEVDLSGSLGPIVNFDYATVRDTLVSYSDITRFVRDLSKSTCEAVHEHDAMRRAVGSDPPSFDVVLVEFLASECVARVSAALRVPLVYVVAPPLPSFLAHAALGHVSNPAVVSHLLLPQAVPGAFLDRMANVAVAAYVELLLRFDRSWFSSAADRRLPVDADAIKKPSLMFVNAHYVTDASRPLPPIVVPVGGIHLDPPKTVPEDILEFLDNSPHGVILFSLGSIVSVSSLPDHIHDVIVKSLGQFPQRVLLKHENELENKPKNVMTKKWIPQRDVLMHHNVKLFISHGGISGVYEAVDAGVPVLGFPVFFDQPRNLKNLVDAGMAISLDLSSITKETFVNSVTELVNNEKYTKNAKIASELYKDRPMTLEQTVNYWTNYVIRHNDTPHIKSLALNLTWYQYFLLDVIAVLLFIIVLIVYIIIIIPRTLYQYCALKKTTIYSKLKSE